LRRLNRSERHARQHFFEQVLLAGAQLAPAPPPERAQF
jgi:hypothetical protein